MQEIHEWLPLEVAPYSSKSDILLENATNDAIDQITSSFDDSIRNEDTRGEVIILDHAEPGVRFSSVMSAIEPMVVNGLIQIHRVVFGSGKRLGDDWYTNMVQLSGGKELVLPTKRSIKENKISALEFAVDLANDKSRSAMNIPFITNEGQKYKFSLSTPRSVYLVVGFSLKDSDGFVRPMPREELMNAFTIMRERLITQIIIRNDVGWERMLLHEPSEIFAGYVTKEFKLEIGDYEVDISKSALYLENNFIERLLVDCKIIAKSSSSDPVVKLITHRLSDNRVFMTASFANIQPIKVVAEIFSNQVNASYLYREEIQLLDDGKISDLYKNDTWFTATAEPFPCPNVIQRPSRYGLEVKCTTGLIIKLTAESENERIEKHSTLSLQDVEPDCKGFVFERQCLQFTKQRMKFAYPGAKCGYGRYLTYDEAFRLPSTAFGANGNRIWLEKEGSQCFIISSNEPRKADCDEIADGFYCVTPLSSSFALGHVRGVRVQENEDEYQVSWEHSEDATTRMSYKILHVYSQDFADTRKRVNFFPLTQVQATF